MSQNNFLRTGRALILVLSLLSSIVAEALPEDRSKPIQIESDRATRSEKKGTTTYTGNVVLVQGTLLMRADRLEIYSTGNEVDRIIAYGKPAYVEDQPQAGKPLIKARAHTIRYFVAEEKLSLEKNASIDQEGSTLESDTIVYLIKEEVVQADSSGQKGRVKMVIPARESSQTPKDE